MPLRFPTVVMANAAAPLTGSVGRFGAAGNAKADVLRVQQLLNAALGPQAGAAAGFPIVGLRKIPPFERLTEDGISGSTTTAAIVWFQKNVMAVAKPDGVVGKTGATITALLNPPNNATVTNIVTQAIALPAIGSGAAISEANYQATAASLGVEVAAVKAVAKVESSGSGFIADGRPILRFEAHHFSKYTSHYYDFVFPLISVLKRNDSLVQGGEAGLKREYTRLTMAMGLDRDAALSSTSWGLFQIMGFNFKDAGFTSASDMVESMFQTEGDQLAAFGSFIEANSYDVYLKNKEWSKFASHYNGPAYGDYDVQMQRAYDSFSK